VVLRFHCGTLGCLGAQFGNKGTRESLRVLPVLGSCVLVILVVSGLYLILWIIQALKMST
jgi:hypothetical protein